MSELAILGGKRLIDEPFQPFNRIGAEELAAAREVLESGVLSGFLASNSESFLGGPQIREFEHAFAQLFASRHAVSMNSATSCLYAAVGAARITPGDEVIVSPYTMSASVVAPLLYGGVPVFADIEPETFCLDPACVRQAITERTRAILAVNIFGHPAHLHELRAIADEHSLVLIEDNAQAPLAEENGRYAGTIGHIGVFSLNVHKHFQTGEGGVCLTDDDDLALRLQLIRNHGENVVAEFDIDDITNLIGFNYRMTEITAAMARVQLEKLPGIVDERIGFAERLSEGVADLPGITAPVVRDGCRHVYYVWPAHYDSSVVGLSRDVFARALAAEGVPINQGYVKPRQLLPVFQERIAIGDRGFPFNLGKHSYDKDQCPVCLRMNEEEELGFGICNFELSNDTIDAIIAAFHKVYGKRNELAQIDAAA